MTAENKPLPAIPAKRYFTIGEVSELCGVKAYVLRYWEQEFTQLKPMKRRGNRRYYQHHEVLLIRRIRDLLYEQGFTISGARNQLTDTGHAHMPTSAEAFADSEPFDDDADGEGASLRGPRDPAARTRASDLPHLVAPTSTRAPASATSGTGAGESAPADADPVERPAADPLDDASLAALARDDIATIARIGRERGDAEMIAAAAPATVSARPVAGTAAASRTAALQARKNAGSATAPSPASGVYDTEQIRAELLAIRALLVS